MREDNECVCLVFRVARVRAVRCSVGVFFYVSKYSGYLVIECFHAPVTQCSLAQLRVSNLLYIFFGGAAQCVYHSVTHYFVYPSTHIPYSTNRNSIIPVVRVVSAFIRRLYFRLRGFVGFRSGQ